MSGDRKKMCGRVLCEDRRTERFIRHLLEARGYKIRRFNFVPAPSGRGAADAWVLARYPEEVRALRAKNHQHDLCLIAIRDGDALGVGARKKQLDDALREADLDPRAPSERIATPVPTWAIENWILDLLGFPDVTEDQCSSENQGPTWKHVFERNFGSDEKSALRDAAQRWWSTVEPRLPSLEDGRGEVARIEQ
jgi:hypothetical protein